MLTGVIHELPLRTFYVMICGSRSQMQIFAKEPVNPWLSLLQQHRIIAVIRADNIVNAREMALASAAGGIKLIEIAWNTDRAESLIPKLQQELPDCKIGTGTVLDLDSAEKAIACGCSFLFTPHTNPELIAKGVEHNIPVIAGALTPTEIIAAWQAGAAAVKVFPIKVVGGIDYLKCLQPILRDIPLIPTGGRIVLRYHHGWRLGRSLWVFPVIYFHQKQSPRMIGQQSLRDREL